MRTATNPNIPTPLFNQVMTGESVNLGESLQKNNVESGVPFVLSSSCNPAFISANITQLRLSGVGLSILLQNFPTSGTIIEVDLSQNSLNEVPSSLCNLKNLRILNLSNNKLTKIPSALYEGLHVLKKLNLSTNKLVTFPQPPLCLPLLQYLDLSSNKLIAPPPWLLDDLPSSLDTLDLSGNPCFQLSLPQLQKQDSGLPHGYKVADKIKVLKVVGCGLRSPVNEKYLLNFKNLRKLYAGNCDTSESSCPNCLPDISVIAKCVEELYLHQAGLECMPKNILDLKELRKLDISNNRIYWFPPTIRDLSRLTILRVDSCKLYFIPPEMDCLTNVKELYLSKNELSTSEGFKDLASLEVLDLYDNQFIEVPELDKLSRLTAFDFCQNYIEAPSFIMFNSYESLRDHLRYSILQPNLKRLNGPKEFKAHEAEDAYSSSYSGHYSDPESETDGEFLDKTSKALHSSSGSLHNQEVKEFWDGDSDDNFDPSEVPLYNGVGISSRDEVDDLTGQTSHDVCCHPHYFIPFRQTSPVCPPGNLDPPFEGQFDD